MADAADNESIRATITSKSSPHSTYIQVLETKFWQTTVLSLAGRAFA